MAYNKLDNRKYWHKKLNLMFLLSILLLVFQTQIKAQEQLNVQSETAFTAPRPGFSINEIPVNVQLETGMSVGNNFAGNTAFSSFIKPTISFQPEKRLNIQASFGYLQGFNHSFLYYNGEQNSLQITQTDVVLGSVAVSGNYVVNPKLMLSGTVWKQFDMQPPADQLNPRALNFEADGIVVGMQYNINDKMQINASFGYSRGNTPYRSSFNNYWGSPSPFMPSFGAQPINSFNW